MKKRSLIFAFLAVAVSITSLTSCNDDATKPTIIESDNQGTDTKPSETKNYNLKDNEASLMAYNAFLESYPNLTYDDFRVDGRVNTSSNITVFTYGSSTLYLKDGAYYCKTIIIDGKEAYSEYINNEWVKKLEYITINGEKKDIYSISQNQYGEFLYKYETTYDDKGNVLSLVLSSYDNGNWVLTAKNAYTYDTAGNMLTQTSSEFKNGGWVVISRIERIFDASGNLKTDIRSSYTDGVETASKSEFAYEFNGNWKTETIIYSKYENGAWSYTKKFVNIYDENEDIFEMNTYKYQDGGWVQES